MPIDSRIALGVQPAADPMRSYGQALSLKSLMTQQQMHEQQMADAQQAREERRTLADLYRGAVGADGSIDNTKLLTGAAQAGLGHQIPGMRKQIMEADKASADVANLRGQVDERTWKMKRDQLGEVNKALTSLLMQPSVTHDDVIALAQGLVRNGIITPEMGAETVRGLPGNPEQLREFLRQQSLRGLETAKALELMAPKFEKVDAGGDVRFVDTNPWTNPNPQAVTKTMTPGDVQQARDAAAGRSVTMRGQDLTDARAREANQAAAGKTTGEINDRLRVEFNKLPEVEAYKSVIPAQKSAIEAIDRDTPQADMNLIYATAKIFDPTSVVREGEYATVNASQAPAERMQGMLSYLMGGGRLTERTRRQLLDEINSRATAAKSQYDAARASYDDIARRRGADPSLVFQTLDEAKPAPATQARGGPKMPPAEAKPVVVNGTRMTATRAPDGKFYVKLPDGRFAEVEGQ